MKLSLLTNAPAEFRRVCAVAGGGCTAHSAGSQIDVSG